MKSKFQEQVSIYNKHGYNVQFSRVAGMGDISYHFTKIGQDLENDFREFSVSSRTFYNNVDIENFLYELDNYFK